MQRRISILGTRGIPARHSGFETFAERLAEHLVKRGWSVRVYCQAEQASSAGTDVWNGTERIHIPERVGGPLGTIVFDWESTLHAAREHRLLLILGYNTAVFSLMLRLKSRINLFNMDGIEWRREKWGAVARAWLRVNETLACQLGHHLIADHPAIQEHLAGRVPRGKISMIPYGADSIEAADPMQLIPLGLSPRGYALVVARAEPENSLLEIVRAFSRQPRGIRLVVLGRYNPARSAYHARVMRAASPEVVFTGPIWDRATLAALRFFALLYIHGHRVGGTNPALVEALGAGCAVLAHDNRFNRWVASDGAHFFADENDCADLLKDLIQNQRQLAAMRAASRKRHEEDFRWETVLNADEQLLEEWHGAQQ